METCSGGGGRFDLGMLYFSPQIWASDNTDAFSRCRIQYGLSLAYPPSVMSVPRQGKVDGSFPRKGIRLGFSTWGSVRQYVQVTQYSKVR